MNNKKIRLYRNFLKTEIILEFQDSKIIQKHKLILILNHQRSIRIKIIHNKFVAFLGQVHDK